MSSILIKSVCDVMERIAPLRLAEKWDNVGLLLESPIHKPGRHRILVTIDLTASVLDEALANEAAVIVSYHPPIFTGLKSLTLQNPLQGSLLRCAAEGISVYCPHTALDSVWGGINDWLAEGLLNGKHNGEVHALLEQKLGATGVSEGGVGRFVKLKEKIPMKVLEARIKSYLKLQHLQVGYPANAINSDVGTIAICAGSGGSILSGTDADVYFTGEMQHHEVLASVAAGKHVVLCGHTNTERGYLPILAARLSRELQDKELQEQNLGPIEVVVSQRDRHPLQIV